MNRSAGILTRLTSHMIMASQACSQACSQAMLTSILTSMLTSTAHKHCSQALLTSTAHKHNKLCHGVHGCTCLCVFIKMLDTHVTSCRSPYGCNVYGVCAPLRSAKGGVCVSGGGEGGRAVAAAVSYLSTTLVTAWWISTGS